MCRSQAHGGRRCPHSGGTTAEARREYQRQWRRERRRAARQVRMPTEMNGPDVMGSSLATHPDINAVRTHWYSLRDVAKGASASVMRAFWGRHEELTRAAGRAVLDVVGQRPYTSAAIDEAADALGAVSRELADWRARVAEIRDNPKIVPASRAALLEKLEDERVRLNSLHKFHASQHRTLLADLYTERRAELVETMRRVRSFGTAHVDIDPRSDPESVMLAMSVAKMFPDDLIKAANAAAFPVLIRDAGVRATYRERASRTFVVPYTKLVTHRSEVPDELWRKMQPFAEGKLGVYNTPEVREIIENINARAAELSEAGQARPWVVIRRTDGYIEVSGSREVTEDVAEIEGCRGRPESMAHELAHRIEYHNAAIGEVCRAFRLRRSGGEKVALHNPGETAFDGGFVDPYIGRTYDDDSEEDTGVTEVFSTGVEAALFGRYGGLVGRDGLRADNEHRELVIGLLATAEPLSYTAYRKMLRKKKKH